VDERPSLRLAASTHSCALATSTPALVRFVGEKAQERVLSSPLSSTHCRGPGLLPAYLNMTARLVPDVGGGSRRSCALGLVWHRTDRQLASPDLTVT
jgi:hypothetical protein